MWYMQAKRNGNSGKSIISLFYEGTFIMNRFMCVPKVVMRHLGQAEPTKIHRTHGSFSPGKKNKKMQRGERVTGALIGPRPKKW